MIEFTFRCSRGTWFVKTHFPGALLGRKTENASVTAFQMSKPEHANAPNGTAKLDKFRDKKSSTASRPSHCRVIFSS